MTIIAQRPEQILEYQADIASRFTRPTVGLATYARRFMIDATERGGWDTARTMFYPAIADDERVITLEAGGNLCHHIGRDTAEAVTYQITPEMGEVMQAVKTDFTGVRVDEAELPGPNGFAWYDDGWPVTDRRGDAYLVRAVTWNFTRAILRPDSDPEFGQASTWPCVRITLWVHSADDRVEAADPDRDALLGQLQMIHSGVIPFGIDLDIDTEASRDEAGELLGMVHRLWMFLGMEIAITHRPRIKNHYRKRVAKSLKHTEVNVVILRRARHVGPEPEESVRVDWSWRWVVQGHWRHLTNPKAVPGTTVHRAVAIDGPKMGDKICAVCGGELTWVRPYIKGPDGKPIKVSNTIMKLAR
jgi:hypothetical protein